MRKHIPPQSLFFLVGEEIAHCPLTVPSGDTPCLTAGDARRVNPWSGDAAPSDTDGVAQHPLLPVRVAPFNYEFLQKMKSFFVTQKGCITPF